MAHSSNVLAGIPQPTLARPMVRERWRRTALWRRWLLALLVVGQTAFAAWYLLRVLPYHGGTWVELTLVAVFAVLYAWIAVGFWTAVYGLLLRLAGGDRWSLLRRHGEQALAGTPLAPTAVVLPIYHEPVQRTLRGLRAIYRDLERSGHLGHFEFYILSDSRDPEVWLEEQASWRALCNELGASGRLFYRRRTVNLNFKSGNVADFLRRWGRRCRYTVVLDADSLVGADTLVRMVRLMQREPGVGILQTNPGIVRGRSVFARLQQFANRVYSPLFATGLAAIQLGEATFWGHNAILRTDAFMKHCGLRKLPGAGLFQGPILSHDFVEAAYMGRADYEVWLEPGLGQSFEESPPTLADELSRDRRWARGNLQHLWSMLVAPRLRFAHRMAFFNGIMGYLASPLWLVFLALATAEATQLVLIPIDYFPEDRSGLFPLWTEWQPGLAISLAVTTFSMLFAPKFMAFIDIVVSDAARSFGGPLRLLAGIVLESLMSMLLAPIRMLAHSGYVLGALANVSLSWAGQNRTDETLWRDSLLAHGPGMIAALVWAAFAWYLDPVFFLWSLPVAMPLAFAVPTSVCLGRIHPGQWLKDHGLLVTPEESRPPLLLRDADDVRAAGMEASGLSRFEEALILPAINATHRRLARSHGEGRRRTGLRRLAERCLLAGPDALTPDEQSHLCRDRETLEWLHQAIWRSGPETYWGRRLMLRGN